MLMADFGPEVEIRTFLPLQVIQKSALVQELTALRATRAFSLPLNY